MERMIIFRGRTGKNEWIYGNLIDYQGFASILTIDASMHTPKDLLGEEIIRGKVDEGTIGQYTELNDKDGIPIYEGDILRLPHRNVTYKVVWSEKFASWGCIRLDQESSITTPLFTIYQDYEVIGNIYDNPELLEGNV